jgi:hypothetical protein
VLVVAVLVVLEEMLNHRLVVERAVLAYRQTLQVQQSAEQVAVVGNGNVALDVSRMLIKHADDLLATEIPDNV